MFFPTNQKSKLIYTILCLKNVDFAVISLMKLVLKIFDSIITLRFGALTYKFWDVDVNDIVMLKLVEKKTNSKYLVEYLDKFLRQLGLILHKMSR